MRLSWLAAVVVAANITVFGCRPAVGIGPRLASATPPARNMEPLRTVCKREKVAYPPRRVFIRAFKQERELELWGANADGVMHLLRTYPIAAASGEPGPKRREGDLQ